MANYEADALAGAVKVQPTPLGTKVEAQKATITTKGPGYKQFIDNPPLWNPKTSKYVYDFKGRVTEASIKNF